MSHRSTPSRFAAAGRLAAWSLLVAAPLVLSDAKAQVCATPGSAGTASISGVVNTYWTPAVGTYGNGSASIVLSGQRGASATLAAGDLVLVIQMQCANLTTTDSLAYGDGAAGEPASGYAMPATGCVAGRYQFVRAGAGSSNGLLSLSGSPLTAVFEQAAATNTTGRRTFQVIRVPQYLNATLGGAVTAAEWNGSSGGAVILDVAFALNLNGQSINVDGLGFRGGAGRARAAADAVERFRWDDDTRHAVKGEGIAGTPRFVSDKRDPGNGAAGGITDLGAGWGGYPTGTAQTGDFARGAPGNAGGGGAYWDGVSDNGGGGGGGNGRAGGRGAAGWRSAGYAGVLADYSNIADRKWGFGGAGFAEYGVARLVLGGGGGAGDNNANSTAAQSSGAAGGGIVMVRADSIGGTGAITARGGRAADNGLNDGAGGGGAGGSALVVSTTSTASLSIDVRGGRGGDAWTAGTSAHGNGGGGAGGVVVRTPLASVALGGGAPGNTNTAQGQPGGVTHGAEPGGDGRDVSIAAAADTPGSNVGRTCKADLRITKTNTPLVAPDDQANDSVVAGSPTTYDIVVTNNGPLTADDALIQDPQGAGLGSCVLGTPACSASGGTCPIVGNGAGQLSVANLQGTGVTIPQILNGGAVTIKLTCTVQ